jgi:pimeloyl-ACP methyl ester carboxylesterase
MEKKISYRDRTLSYQVWGSGLPVMLVHGFTEDHSFWDPPVSVLKEKYRLIVPDLPGSGGSEFNERMATLEDFAACLLAVMDKEKWSTGVLIGHSMGGYISLALAEKYPERLSGLGLFHSSAYPDTEEKKTTRKKSIDSIRRYGVRPYISQSIPGLFSDRFREEHPEKIDECIDRYANFSAEALVLYLEAMMIRPDRTETLKSLSRPLLLIAGEEDKAVPLKDSLQQSHLPDICYIHILGNTAHMGTLENTNLSNQFLDRYLKEIPKA